MNFDEMQILWDSQREHPLYAFDQEALARFVNRQSRKLGCTVSFVERAMILATLGLAALLAYGPLVAGGDRLRLVGAALFLATATYLGLRARRRRERVRNYPQTLLGDLDRAIAQNQFHADLSRTFGTWFLLPAIAVMALRFVSDGTPNYSAIAIAIAGFVLSHALARYELRCVHLPKQRELETLRAKLADPR